MTSLHITSLDTTDFPSLHFIPLHFTCFDVILKSWREAKRYYVVPSEVK